MEKTHQVQKTCSKIENTTPELCTLFKGSFEVKSLESLNADWKMWKVENNSVLSARDSGHSRKSSLQGIGRTRLKTDEARGKNFTGIAQTW